MARFQTLRGMRDILPGEVERWQRLEAAARDTAEAYGFREIRTPLIEPTELFSRSVGDATDLVRREMYTFKMGDESLTLRPEMTAPVVRAWIEAGLDRVPGSDRLYYIGPMFRHERPQKGRQRQFHQLGVEVFGREEPAVDAETIEMCVGLVTRLGLAEIGLLLNSVGDAVCRPEYRKTLRTWLVERTDRLCEDCRRRADENPMRVFDCKVPGCREILTAAPVITDHLCEGCRTHFAGVVEALDAYGVPYRLDPRLVRGLDYYVRTAFEVVSGSLGAQNAVAGGGRYDGLVGALGGKDQPGFGWAMGLERVVLLLDADTMPAPTGPDVLVAPVGDAAQVPAALAARALRKAGRRTLLESSARSFTAHLRRADKLGAARVLLIGEAEAASGVYLLRDMRTGEQTPLAKDEIARAAGAWS